MKRFSHRMASVDIPVMPAIAALVRDNPGTISLGQGVVNYGPPPDALAALPGLMGDVGLNKYQAIIGHPALIDALTQKLADENNIHCGSDSAVMVTAGSNMAFLNCLLAVGDPGDEFILPTPYYFNQEMAIRMVGCVPVPVPVNDDWSLNVEALAAAVTPRTRAIVTVSPNNPTGAVYSKESLTAVNALCAEKNIYHFSDEAYEYFTYDGAEHFSPASLPGAQRHTLSFYSMSKNYGMASWRIGYVVFPVDLLDAMNKVQDTNLICAPVVSQMLALEMLKYGRAWVQPKIDALALVRKNVYQRLEALGDLVEFPKTQGAFYVLLKLPGLAVGTERLAFNRAMAQKHKVVSVPGFTFGLFNTQQANYQRLSYGALESASVDQGAARYVTAVKDWYKHTRV
ncbi:MAG: aminotransferase class I/II-fold pyridoxal phosphate-dependent enzyme [Alcaligenaceae bacterium]